MKNQYVSFHSPKKARLWLEGRGLNSINAIKGDAFYLPKVLEANAPTLFLSRQKIGEKDTKHSVCEKGSGENAIRLIDIQRHEIKQWIESSRGFYAHYKEDGIRLVRVNEPNTGRCVKQIVVATLVTLENEVFVGTNRCMQPQVTCPREKHNMKSGEGYHLCTEVCQQVGHAEVDAITQAGEKAKGAIIYLEGHTYACENCKSSAQQAGSEIIVANDLFLN